MSTGRPRKAVGALVSELPSWTVPQQLELDREGEPRDPLRAQPTLDSAADALFRSVHPNGPGLTSLTDHLGYMAFHGWAERLCEESFATERERKGAYDRLVWVHAWANFHLAGSDGHRWVVYGIRDLRRRSSPTIPGRTSATPPALVSLDPRARYSGLWNSLSEHSREHALLAWPHLSGTQLARLRGWLSGDYRGLDAATTNRWANLRLNSRLPALKRLAQELRRTPLTGAGLGTALPDALMGQVLDRLAQRKRLIHADGFMWKALEESPSNHRVQERLRRALLVRGVVYAVNWSFFRWASRELKMDRFRQPAQGCPFEGPERMLSHIAQKLKADSGLKAAFRAIDGAVGGRSGRFSLLGAIHGAARIEREVVHWAMTDDKGFVDHSGRIPEERASQIETFSGSFAGGLRLRQAWRFARDVAESMTE